jgi:hypothetical protein
MRRLLAVLIFLATTAGATEHLVPYARDLGDTRAILALDDGTILVSRPSTFDVIALRDRDRDGKADEIRTAIASVEGACGLAFHDGTLFVSGSKRIVAADLLPDGTFGPSRDLVTDLPAGNRDSERPIAIGPDGKIYLGLADQGTLWQFERDGGTRRVYARGLSDLGGITFDANGAARTVPRKNTPVAKTASATFSCDLAGNVYRSSSEPEAMTSSSSEPTRTILNRAFVVSDLPGAEAVVHDEEQDVYFVSGKGFIARISPEGRLLDRSFTSEVKRPRGMTVRGVELWVADGKTVRVFNRVTGQRTRTIDLAPRGAVSLSGIAVGGDDAVYVTDTDKRSGDGRIFRIEEDGDVEIAIHGEELRSPAGIVWDGMRFLVAQAFGNEIVGWQPGHSTTAVLRGPGGFDGLTVLPNGVVIAASANDDGLHFGTTGDLKPLFGRTATPAGISFDRKRNRLLIPSADGNWLEGWTLPPMSPPQPRTAKERPTDAA